MKGLLVIMGVLFVSVTLPFVQKSRTASDPVKVDPKHYKVNFENDLVRVIEFQLEPGGRVSMHSHPDHLIYALTSSSIMVTFPAGKSELREFKAGEVAHQKAETYAGENPGTTESHVLIVEFKRSGMRGVELPNDADISQAARNERWTASASFQIAVNTVLNNRFSYYLAFERDKLHYHLTPYVPLKDLPKNLRGEIALLLSHPYDPERNEFWFRIQFAARERPIKEDSWRPAVSEEVKNAVNSFIDDTVTEVLNAK